jgi:hypothetical protein
MPCGYPVNNCGIRTFGAVQFSVDRRAFIVRNPHQGVRKEAIVENLGRTEWTYSLRYFLLQPKVVRTLHNPSVLTGTTIDLEFSRI